MKENKSAMALPALSHSRYTTLLSDIEKGANKIPQFQRDFVWTIQKSAALLDSISLPDPKDGDVVSFVLDGQKRLTSLFSTLNRN